MEFIVDNYIWFIVGGIIIFMTLIGFIADKTNYIENQKNHDKKKKEDIKKKKKEPISKSREKFSKQIGDGKNLVLQENNIEYPVELDRPASTIEIPVMETPKEEPKQKKEKKKKKHKNEKQDEFIKDLKLEGLSIAGEPVVEPEQLPLEDGMGTVSYNYNQGNDELDGVDPSLTAPLEGGVLRLDDYDNKETVNSTVEPPISIEPAIEENPSMESAPIKEIPQTELDMPTTEKELTKMADSVAQAPISNTNEVESVVPDFPSVDADTLVEIPNENVTSLGQTSEMEKTIEPMPSSDNAQIKQSSEIPEPTLDTLKQAQVDDDVWKF